MPPPTPVSRRVLLRPAVLAGAALAAVVAVVAAAVLLRDREPAFSTVPYAFSVVPVDGGGWVTGLVAHPSGAVYARTDVGGAYRWDEQGQRWRELLVQDAVEAPRSEDYYVDALAVAPSDPERVYLAVGDALERDEGRVLASDDGGRTWGSAEVGAAVNGNAEWRQGGARLAVSPDDPDVVLLGTRTDGLLRSDDGGSEWERVDGLPDAEPVDEDSPAGVAFSAFDPEREDVVWAGVQGVGVLRSEDGGDDWDLVHPTPGATPRDAELAADGSLWAVVAGGDPSVVRISGDGAVSGTGPGGSPAVLAVDPQDPERVVVGDEGVRDGHLWQTADGGRTWEAVDVRVEAPGTPWVAQTDLESYLSAGELAFDPARPGTLWFAEGMGVWRTEDLADGSAPDEVVWRGASEGVEELVANDALRPAGEELLTASWDRGVFRHPQGAAAELPLSGRFGSAWSLDADPADPSYVVAVVDDHRYCCAEDGLAGQSGWSDDGGRTWQRFASLARGDHPEGLAFGEIAVVRGRERSLVWVPSRGGRVHHSTDGGATWTESDYPGSEPHFAEFLHRATLTAEADGALTVLDTDGVMRSADGGATWQRQDGEGLPGPQALRFNATMAAVPGRPGELVLTTGLLDEGSHGLFRSRDGGSTWRELPGLQDVGRVAVGPPLRDGGPPALYATGRLGGTQGLWRSDDDAASWQLMATAPSGRYQEVTVIAPDPERPGEVVLGFLGTGWMTGRPR